MNARGRPRIPTPDVQKDSCTTDKENGKQNTSVNGFVQSGLHPSDIPVVQVIKSASTAYEILPVH